jgi:hypothetical protein
MNKGTHCVHVWPRLGANKDSFRHKRSSQEQLLQQTPKEIDGLLHSLLANIAIYVRDRPVSIYQFYHRSTRARGVG